MFENIIKLLNSGIEEDICLAMHLLSIYSNENILRLLKINLEPLIVLGDDKDIINRYRLAHRDSPRKYYKIDNLYFYRGYRQLIIRPKRLYPNDVVIIR